VFPELISDRILKPALNSSCSQAMLCLAKQYPLDKIVVLRKIMPTNLERSTMSTQNDAIEL
jgi:hypothetical protein